MSRSVIAWTFAPATPPLCAIGVAIEIPFAQLWPGKPGMFDGNRNVTVGMFHDTSPMSSDPPPMRVASLTGPPIESIDEATRMGGGSDDIADWRAGEQP